MFWSIPNRTKLEMLKIGVDIGAVAETSQLLKQQYPEVFSGIGKLNTKQISLHIDPEVKPVAQPYAFQSEI